MALRCALVTHPEADDRRADPITRVIAKRVAKLRDAAGMNQTRLGAEMAKLRPNWSRSTVAKLEGNRRETISVTDLLALAVALKVPPVWLLIDPDAGTATPIVAGAPLAPDFECEPWTALWWVAGRRPVDSKPGALWSDAEEKIYFANEVEKLLGTYDRWLRETRFLDDAIDMANSREESTRQILASLVAELRQLGDLGVVLPGIPSDIRERATELGIDLPSGEA